jgi:hypothetical protein
VFIADSGAILRRLAGESARGYHRARESGLFSSLASDGLLLQHEEVESRDGEIWLRQERLPFVSYPYEWSFSMMKVAALAHLDVLVRALDCGLILKDGSAYNVQFVGTRPVFIDVGSLTPYRPGSVWSGYAQFCRTFLNPLLLSAYSGHPFNQVLRGAGAGIAPAELRRLLPFRAKISRLALTHVVLQDFLQNFGRGATQVDDLPNTIEKPSLIRFLIGLRRGIAGLRTPKRASEWATYDETCSYSTAGTAQKERAVEQSCRTQDELVWDVGANLGRYSMIAAQKAKYVVAMEADPTVADRMFHRLRGESNNVLPLVMDVADPSPAQGWAEVEHSSLTQRGPADLVLALAVIHHLRIGAGVPLALIVAWLRRCGRRCLVEFVPKSDNKVQELLRGREDVFADYTIGSFEAIAAEAFEIDEVIELADSGRRLYSLAARA